MSEFDHYYESTHAKLIPTPDVLPLFDAAAASTASSVAVASDALYFHAKANSRLVQVS